VGALIGIGLIFRNSKAVLWDAVIGIGLILTDWKAVLCLYLFFFAIFNMHEQAMIMKKITPVTIPMISPADKVLDEAVELEVLERVPDVGDEEDVVTRGGLDTLQTI
jgi:hypothetical protein